MRSFWKTLAIMIAGVGILIQLFFVLPGLSRSLGLSGVRALVVDVIGALLYIKIITWIYKQPSGKRSEDTNSEGTSSN